MEAWTNVHSLESLASILGTSVIQVLLVCSNFVGHQNPWQSLDRLWESRMRPCRLTLTLERCRQGDMVKSRGKRDQLSEVLVTVTVILLLLVLYSATVNVLFQTRGQGAL